jgi:hypothetical protein
MSTLIEALDHSKCRKCAEAMLWLGIRMYPQPDVALVSFAKRELDRDRPDLAIVYVTEVRDPKTEGLAEVTRRLGEDSPPRTQGTQTPDR